MAVEPVAIEVMAVAVFVAVPVLVRRGGARSLSEDRQVLRRTTVREPRNPVVVRPARVPWCETRRSSSLTGHLWTTPYLSTCAGDRKAGAPAPASDDRKGRR